MNCTLNDQLRDEANQVLIPSSAPGASIALLLDGSSFFVSAVGFRDLERNIPLESDARFYIYSVTKSLIAAVILQLVEQGYVSLDAPVQEYLPQLSLEIPVTVRQLLNHTGGIPDYGGLPSYFEAIKTNPMDPWTSEEFLSATLSQGLIFPPGQGWRYSNIGFLLLRKLIEAVFHSSLSTAFYNQIFGPLDLQHTFVAQTLDDAQQLTPGYSSFFERDDSFEDVRSVYHPEWVSHGVVIATALELAQLFDSIFSGRLLSSEESLVAMLEPVEAQVEHPLFQEPAYGLGLMIDRGSRFGILAGHGGGGPGYSAGALTIPDACGRRITSVALANSDQDDLGLQIAHSMATTLGDVLETPPNP